MSDDFKKFINGLADAGAFLGLLFTAAGLLGRYNHFIEIFTHVKPLLALCFAGYIVLKIVFGHRKAALIAVVPLLINALPPLMLLLPQQRQTPPAEPQRITVLQANLLSSNRSAQKLLDLVEETSPDVIVLQETNRRWMDDLSALKQTYPVYAEHPREDNFGAAIFCRETNAVASIEFLNDPDMLPLSKIVFSSGDKKLKIYGVHPLAPIGPCLWRWRNEYTLEFARKMAGTEGPVLVTGDLNNTPWAHYYKKFREISGLLDSAQGRGALATWPAGNLLKIPLDHCFHSPEVIILRRERGPHIGSDHYPLIIQAVF